MTPPRRKGLTQGERGARGRGVAAGGSGGVKKEKTHFLTIFSIWKLDLRFYDLKS
jgi:hypothetical protein